MKKAWSPILALAALCSLAACAGSYTADLPSSPSRANPQERWESSSGTTSRTVSSGQPSSAEKEASEPASSASTASKARSASGAAQSASGAVTSGKAQAASGAATSGKAQAASGTATAGKAQTTSGTTTSGKAQSASGTTTSGKASAGTEKPAEAPQQSSADIALVSVTSPIGRNEMASLTIKGRPNTEYSITVYYSSGAATADGLENKTSDSNGNVTWTWKVGGRTKPGEHRIVITGGDKKLETKFTTTE